MDQEKDNDQFHDSESDDIYDLYNACNGAMRDGMLDIAKLDELSEEEAAMLDMPRLKALGDHIASGCARCEAVIRTLNWARGLLKKSAEKPPPD